MDFNFLINRLSTKIVSNVCKWYIRLPLFKNDHSTIHYINFILTLTYSSKGYERFIVTHTFVPMCAWRYTQTTQKYPHYILQSTFSNETGEAGKYKFSACLGNELSYLTEFIKLWDMILMGICELTFYFISLWYYAFLI